MKKFQFFFIQLFPRDRAQFTNPSFNKRLTSLIEFTTRFRIRTVYLTRWITKRWNKKWLDLEILNTLVVR